MPELPEVEIVRRGLSPSFENAVIERVEQRRPDLRFPFPERFANRLEGRRVTSFGRRAKYLLADLDDAEVLVMHLGMSGSFKVETGEKGVKAPGNFQYPRSADARHDHVVFHLRHDGGGPKARVIYNDPRRFGFMTLIDRASLAAHPLFARMGIEPTGNQLDGATLARLFKDKKAPLKTALLDQHLVAGLGNIYVCEALHRSALSPARAAGTLATKTEEAASGADRLAAAIRQVIAEAIEAGGSSLRDHRLTDGSLGYFQHRFTVYGREGEDCRREGCGGTIVRETQSGRSTFHCPRCQK